MLQNPGLEGIIAAETKIGLVDGENGHLVYRGYWAKDLAIQYSFEEVAFLILNASLPTSEELSQFKDQLKSKRNLPSYVKEILDVLPLDMEVMSVLRTAVSALGRDKYGWAPTIDQALDIIALVPTVIAYRYHQLKKTPFIEPHPTLDHVANYLYMLKGEEPNEAHVRSLSAYFILTIEHGMNASTFTSRVVLSTESDIVSAITGAIGTMKGPLHGGAPSHVIDMLDQIGSKENAEAWIRQKLENGVRLMGFGHRVYKTHDPRSVALRTITQQLADKDPWLDLAVYVEDLAIRLLDEYKPGRRLYTNVEFYAAAVLRAVEMPKELYPATFTASRVVGWSAHVLEQASNNRIYRPKGHYTGQIPQE